MRPGWAHLVSLMISNPPRTLHPQVQPNDLEQGFRTRLTGSSSERSGVRGAVLESPSSCKTCSAPSSNLVPSPPRSAQPDSSCPTSSHFSALTSPLFLATS